MKINRGQRVKTKLWYVKYVVGNLERIDKFRKERQHEAPKGDMMSGKVKNGQI